MVLNEKDLRCLVINNQMRDSIKRLMLTKNHINVLRFVASRDGTTSSDLAKHQNTLVQGASQLLKNIHGKGYLERFEHKSLSGGIEFTYFVSEVYKSELKEQETQ
ncbi:MAG: hypothetical protein CMG60_07900 [Candidatus Marinimicrobia bacterium]|nr:hypothetical protein [Candidatus Neomarinimicrobiota bacterium]